MALCAGVESMCHKIQSSVFCDVCQPQCCHALRVHSTNSLFQIAMLQTLAKDIAIMKQIEWHKGQLRALKGVFNEIVAWQAFLSTVIEDVLNNLYAKQRFFVQAVPMQRLTEDNDQSNKVSISELEVGQPTTSIHSNRAIRHSAAKFVIHLTRLSGSC